MAYLLLGLVIFLGLHSVRIVADGWRSRMVQRWGIKVYRGVYSLLSLLGFALIVYGFGVARDAPMMLWMPAPGMRHATALLTLVAFVFLAAAYVPRNAIKARLHHPMILAVKSWALGHLLSNGSAAHVLLFGSFLVWGVVSFIVARKRDRALGTAYPTGTPAGTAATVVVGILVWAAFAFKLHGWLIGVKPFG